LLDYDVILDVVFIVHIDDVDLYSIVFVGRLKASLSCTRVTLIAAILHGYPLLMDVKELLRYVLGADAHVLNCAYAVFVALVGGRIFNLLVAAVAVDL